MKFNDMKDTFLARWLDGKLSKSELDDFEKSQEHQDYSKIIEASNRLYVSPYDKKKAFENLQFNLKQEQKRKKIQLRWITGVAASIIILFGINYFFLDYKTVKAGYGESIAYVLPDQSEVILNSRSQIKYNPFTWKYKRKIKLEGEAYFKVKKGKDFEVLNNGSAVLVLGTEFNVRAFPDYFEVSCFEGKVKAQAGGDSAILIAGNAFRSIGTDTEKYQFSEEIPQWLKGESSFYRVPLLQVIKALEAQYQLKIISENVDVNQKFTGSFTHKDLSLALETVFSTMEIEYRIEKKNTIILSD
ncbi:FecR family protein [Marinifilum caeruleilacunae]|uniref:FecR family protein n=1 Tax=Marinifilum caeruleilacunae TaxID=2499076 RepID=A0ABX1X1A0_9BACT|nr:FecR family protein [Marinifilum caeruleilacunae]NOU62094.1 FecR family protein [Marinifilum caeruleilacunae]